MLEQVEKDPKLLSAVARKMLLVQMDAIHRKLRDPNAPLGQRQAFAEFLAKVGDAYPKAATAQQAGPGFSVNIVFGGDKQLSAPVQVQAVEVVNELPSATSSASPAQLDSSEDSE